jgi:hypothetical protein
MGDDERSKAGEATEAAAQQSRQVAQSAKAEASQVTDTAKDQARQVKDEAATQARNLVDQAKSELRSQSRSRADQAAKAVRRVADQAAALAEGRTQDAGPVADYARKASGRARQVADRLDERGVEGVMNDVQDFARRRPGAFLLGCAAAGFVAGRLIRGGAASSSGPSGTPDEGFPVVAPVPTETPTYLPPSV